LRWRLKDERERLLSLRWAGSEFQFEGPAYANVPANLPRGESLVQWRCEKRTTGSSVCKNVLRLGPDRCRDVKIIGTRHDFAKSEVRSYEAIQGKTIVLYSLMSSKYFSVYRQHCSDRHHSSALRHFVCYACLLLCHPVQCFRLWTVVESVSKRLYCFVFWSTFSFW